MKKKNILKVATIIIFALNVNNTFGQTVLYSQDFETNLDGYSHTPSQTPATDPGKQYFHRTEPSNSTIYEGSVGPYTNITGSWLFVGSNPNSINSSNPGIISTGLINVNGYENFKLSIDFGAVPSDWDASDELRVEYSWDNTSWSTLYDFESPATNNPLVLANNTTEGNNTSNGIILTYALQTVVSDNFTGSGNSLYARVVCDSQSNYEAFGLDNIILTGTSTSTDPSIAFNTSTSSVNETDTDVIITNGIPLALINYAADVTITPTVNIASTADNTDYTIDVNSLTFNADETLYIPLTIHDDADMVNETIIIDFTVTNGTATVGTSQHTVTIIDNDLPNIIINEILADPGAVVDANGDGNTDSGDEFVEFVNTDISAHNLIDYTISDSNGVRYTFLATTIPAGGSVVIFGGGTATNIPGITAIASGLSFNNTSDSVILKNADGIIIATYTYGSEANSDESIGRSNDLTGDFVKHSNISTNPVLASPGRYNTSNMPFSTLTWTGKTDNNWATDSNWSSGTAPIASDDVQVLKTTNQPTVSTAVAVNSVTINSGASLLTKDAISFAGNVTYKRNLPLADSWYYVSSPVDDETIQNLIANHTFVPSPAVASRIGFAPYDNTQAISTNKWVYRNTSSTGDLENAKGYSVQLDEVGDISFTGTIRTEDTNASVDLVLGSPSGDNFNLLGNPYTSYINSTTFLTTQSDDLELTFWMWNGSSYSTRTTGAHADFMIAPGQSFFVEAKTADTVIFTESNQSHNTIDTFQKSTLRPEIKLKISDQTSSRYAEIFYINGTTTGFDDGYDGKMFGGISQPFAIYTHLVFNSEGKNYQVQSLPNSNFEDMIIPIGVDAKAGKEISISVEALNLPNDLNVFLEDKLTNIFTRLDEESTNYKITLTENLNGIGRFYLHTSANSVLSIDELNTENISIYKTNNSNLRITGLSQGKSTITLFNILGKQVLNSTFNSKQVQNISLPKLASGIYIVLLKTETSKLNKKITLE